jgi:hypothetical protein
LTSCSTRHRQQSCQCRIGFRSLVFPAGMQGTEQMISNGSFAKKGTRRQPSIPGVGKTTQMQAGTSREVAVFIRISRPLGWPGDSFLINLEPLFDCQRAFVALLSSLRTIELRPVRRLGRFTEAIAPAFTNATVSISTNSRNIHRDRYRSRRPRKEDEAVLTG